MPKPEIVQTAFACGPRLCGMDAATAKGEETRIYVAGDEGIIKQYDPSDVQNSILDVEIDLSGEGDERCAATCLAASPDGKELAVGLVGGDVNLYKLPSLEFDGKLTRFTAPVLGLHYGMGGAVIAACSFEAGIRVVRRSNTSQTLVLDEHDGGVKSVVWDPKGEFLASAGFDGCIKVWSVDPSLDEIACQLVKSEQYFGKETMGSGGGGGDSDFRHLGKVSWQPEGTFLSLSGDSDPLILKRGTWERTRMVPEEKEHGHLEQITLSAYSPNGRHLATAGLEGRIIVWDMEEQVPVKMYMTEDDVPWRDVKWLPGRGQDYVLAAITTEGRLTTVSGVIPTTKPAKKKPVSGGKSSTTGRASTSGATAVDADADAAVPARGGSSTHNSAENMFDEEAAEDDGEVSEADTAASEEGTRGVADGDVTAGLDGSVAVADSAENHDVVGIDGGDGDVLKVVTEPLPAMPLQIATTPLQDPFQPSSTPLGDTRRYLCWNRIGTIISVDENSHNAVEIEFADKSAGRNQRFMDSWNFVMGSLCGTGAVFASVAQDEEDNDFDSTRGAGRSVLYYKALGRRSTGEDWTRKMPKGESVIGVAAGRGWAAAATDRQLVRIFTGSGLQGEIMMLPGPAVTMVGGGDLLTIVYHKGSPLGESQNLGYLLLDVNGKRELSQGGVSVSPSSELTWLGFSDEHMVVAMDSSGLLTGLTQSLGWRWTPLLDTLKVSKNKRDRFWPVGIVTGKLLAATLKGGEEHPAAYPRPVLTVSALSLDGEEMTKFEKTYPAAEARVKHRRFNLDKGFTEDGADQEELEGELMSQQAQLDSMIVKRIQEACAGEKAGRAMDLASLLSLEKSFQIAIKVANHHGLTQLAAAMEDAMIAKTPDEMDEEDVDEGGWSRNVGAPGLSGRGTPRRGGGGVAAAAGDGLSPLERARLMGMSSVPGRAAGNGRHAAEDEDEIEENKVIDSDGDDSASDTGVPDRAKVAEPADRDGRGEQEDEVQVVLTTKKSLARSGNSSLGGDIRSSANRLSKHGRGKEDVAGSDDEEFDGSGSGLEEENEQELGEASSEKEALSEAPPPPLNPFARGTTFSSPPRKKRKDVLETMNDLRANPSPVAKRQTLTRQSSFAAEARTKKRHDRNVL